MSCKVLFEYIDVFLYEHVIWYMTYDWCNVVASHPTITSSVTDGCIVPGQNVSLTCKVTYSGTNLMPLNINWYWSRLTNYMTKPTFRLQSGHTKNSSSVHQSSLVLMITGQSTDNYWCIVEFSSPTDTVLPGVQKQYSNQPDFLWSSAFSPRAVASKILTYLLTYLLTYNLLTYRKCKNHKRAVTKFLLQSPNCNV